MGPITDKLLFAAKIIVVVIGVRILTMVCGLSLHIPVLDPLIYGMRTVLLNLGQKGIAGPASRMTP